MDLRDTDPVCSRLGDLAASLSPDEEGRPDGAQWAHISQQLDRRRSGWSRTRLVPALALSAIVLVAAGGYLLARRPLGYRVQACSELVDGAACTTGAGSLAFTDGTRIELGPDTQIHAKPLPFARGAELSLEGEAHLSVVHRAGARWAVLAGPFRVEVTGTRFQVRWSKSLRALDVAVMEGEVRVSGGTLTETAILRPGQSLHADLDLKAGQPSKLTEHEVPRASAPEQTTDERVARAGTAQPATSYRGPHRRSPGPREQATSSARQERGNARKAGTAVSQFDPAQARPSESPSEAPPPGLGDHSWASADSLGLPPPSPAPGQPAAREPGSVIFAADGRLDGGMTGRAWLARGNGTRLSLPASTDGYISLEPGPEGFCTSGTVAALRCVNENVPKARCNWEQNWGLVIGFDVKPRRQAWGAEAARGIAVEFHGRSASYRLNAHRKGDPGEKVYCIEGYRSGQMVTPGSFKSKCWDDDGEPLTDFKDVDMFNLQFSSGMEYVAFHYCVSGIRLER